MYKSHTRKTINFKKKEMKLLTNEQQEFFFLSGFSFTDTDESQDSRGREESNFYSTLPLLPADEHSDIYFATFHVRLILHISNRTACIYQDVSR